MLGDLLGVGGCAWSLLVTAAVRAGGCAEPGAACGALAGQLMAAAAASSPTSSTTSDELWQPLPATHVVGAGDGSCPAYRCRRASTPARDGDAPSAAAAAASRMPSPTGHLMAGAACCRGQQHDAVQHEVQPTGSQQEQQALLLAQHCTKQAGAQPQPPQLAARHSEHVEEADDLCLMLFYKVLPCSQLHSHSWNSCPFLHHGEKARRRSLLEHRYNAVICPDVRKKGGCPRGEGCPFTHSMFELHMHPQRYRTVMCKDGVGCQRPFCFFAHSIAELRPVTETLPFGMLALGQADSSGDAARGDGGGSSDSSVQYSMASLCERLSSLAAAAAASLAADSVRAPSPSGSSGSVRGMPGLLPGQQRLPCDAALSHSMAQLSYATMQPLMQQFAPVAAETTMLAVPVSSGMPYAMGGQVLQQAGMGSMMHGLGTELAYQQAGTAAAHAHVPSGGLSAALSGAGMLASVNSGSGHAFTCAAGSMDMFSSGVPQAVPYSYAVHAGHMQPTEPQQQQQHLLLQAAAVHAGWPAAAPLPPSSAPHAPLLQLPAPQHGRVADRLAAMGGGQVVASQAQVLMAPHLASLAPPVPALGHGQFGEAVQQQVLQQHMVAAAHHEQQQQQLLQGMVHPPLL